MNKRDLRTCCVCRRSYHFCPVCNEEDKNKEPWYFVYCSENCKDIYNVMSSFENGKIDAETANEQLSKLDLSQKDNFGNSYKNTLSKISTEIDKIKADAFKENANIKDEKMDEVESPDKFLKSSIRKKGTKMLNSDFENSNREYNITIQ